MASIPTLANMMLSLYTPPKDYNLSLLEGQRLQAGRTGNQTGLLELAELQRQVQTAELARQYQREHPEILLGQPAPGGTPTQGLGSLPTTAGPLTQITTMPGQAPQTQTIPAYPDASRFAQGPGGGPVPTDQLSLSTLPTRPDPLRALVQQNPDAARLVMQQQQQAQDRALQVEEGRLKRQLTVAGVVGQFLQGATDQQSYDMARERLQEIAPQIAQRLPQTYSKEAVQPYLDMALSRKETVAAQIETLKQQVEVQKANLTARTELAKQQIVPKYTGNAELDAAIAEEMQARKLPLQSMPSQEVLTAARKGIEEGKYRVAAGTGVEAARIERTEKPLEGEAAKAVADLTAMRTMTEHIASKHKDAYTGLGKEWLGNVQEKAGGVIPGVGTMGAEEVDFRRTVRDVQDLLARLRSGAALPASEQSRLERMAPSLTDTPEVFKAKLASFQDALDILREARLRVSTTGRGQLREETQPRGAKVISRSALHAEADRRGVSREQAEQQAQAKGYEVR